jgi:hypothetical protein
MCADLLYLSFQPTYHKFGYSILKYQEFPVVLAEEVKKPVQFEQLCGNCQRTSRGNHVLTKAIRLQPGL